MLNSCAVCQGYVRDLALAYSIPAKTLDSFVIFGCISRAHPTYPMTPNCCTVVHAWCLHSSCGGQTKSAWFLVLSLQDLEDKHSGEALDIAQANLAAAHDQVSQLHTQLQQAQAHASAMSNAEAQVSQLQSQLQLQHTANDEQATAVAALTAGVEGERSTWQAERLGLLGRAKVTKEHFLLHAHAFMTLNLLCHNTFTQHTTGLPASIHVTKQQQSSA